MDWKVHERSNEVFIGEVYDVFVMMYQYVWTQRCTYSTFTYIYCMTQNCVYIYIYVCV